MWRRFRSRSMAPRRPAMYPDQLGLVLIVAAGLVGGIGAVLYALLWH